MFDFGWTELAVIGIVALLIIGPKDLPKVLRTLGQWSRRLRGLAREFQGHVDDVIREAELEDVRDGVNKVRRKNIGQSINKMVDPDGRVARELDEVDRAARRRPTRKAPSSDGDGATARADATPPTPKSNSGED
jgi:sec-independent protein translocase protein TatB